jgi:hypothetical protein
LYNLQRNGNKTDLHLLFLLYDQGFQQILKKKYFNNINLDGIKNKTHPVGLVHLVCREDPNFQVDLVDPE